MTWENNPPEWRSILFVLLEARDTVRIHPDVLGVFLGCVGMKCTILRPHMYCDE